VTSANERRDPGETPAVSIVVLGYNGREYIDACLTSVLDQDFDQPYEVLFVDNGSSDGSADLAAQHEGVRVHRLARNYGYCQGNNKGFEVSRGEAVVFLNQDVVVHRSWLRELMEALESDHSVLAAHACVVHPWNEEYGARERTEPLSRAYAPDLSRLGFVEYRALPVEQPAVGTLFVSGVSLMVRRDAIDKIGGYVFDPDMFSYGEDMDLALRIRTAGYRTVVATRAVVYHHHTLQDEIRWSSFVKTVRIIRNRLLALWKTSGWLEFLPLAAITVLGAPFNSGQFGRSIARTAAYFVLLVPPTVAAAFAALAAMPQYAARRRAALARRRAPRGWVLRTLVFDRSRLDQPFTTSAGGRA
jgi:GT2 family glycosyltransferase